MINRKKIIKAVLTFFLVILIWLLSPLLQAFLCSNNQTLIFIDSQKDSFWTALALFLLIMGLYMLINPYGKYNNNKIIASLDRFITSFVIGIILLSFIYQFFHYSFIDYEGVHKKENVFYKSRIYSFSEIRSIKVSTHKRLSRPIPSGERSEYIDRLDYIITLEDGKTINLEKSQRFWENIEDVDEFLKHKVIIQRESLDYFMFEDLIYIYGTASRETIKKIFDYSQN